MRERSSRARTACAWGTIVLRRTEPVRPMTDRDQRFEQLRVQYARSLQDKRAALEHAWRAFEAAPRNDSLRRELATLLHRLAGSAGAYGFASIGERARAADGCMTGQLARDGSADADGLGARVQGVLDELADAIAGLPPS